MAANTHPDSLRLGVTGCLGLNAKKKMELAWTHLLTRNEILRQHCPQVLQQWTLLSHRRRGRPKNTCKRDFGERNVDSRNAGNKYRRMKMKITAQESGQNWIETSDLWTALRSELSKRQDWHEGGQRGHLPSKVTVNWHQ